MENRRNAISGTKDSSSYKVKTQRGKVVCRKQRRLLLLHHASKCNAGASCKNPFCVQMITLRKHMGKCRDKNCTVAHCLSSKSILNHYRMCKGEKKSATCEVCAPVIKQKMWMEKGAHGDQVSGGMEKLLKDGNCVTGKTKETSLASKAQLCKDIRLKQHRLLLIHHTSKCKAGRSCSTKFCAQMTRLLRHMYKCRDRNCAAPFCLSSKSVLNHYLICKGENKSAICEICSPVTEQIRTQKDNMVEIKLLNK